MDRGPAHRGMYRMLLFHICETVIDMLYAGRLVTVSSEFGRGDPGVHAWRGSARSFAAV